MVQAVGPIGLSNAGRVARESGNNCDACDCEDGWCYTFDFTLSDGGWTPATGYQSNYVAGEGWTWGDTLNKDRAFIKRSFAMTTYTSIEIEISTPMTGNARYWWFCNNANIGCTRQGALTTSQVIVARTGSWTTNILSLGFENSSTNPATPFNGYIKRVTLAGPGANPFGENNC
jgi:hypothetical protein